MNSETGKNINVRPDGIDRKHIEIIRRNTGLRRMSDIVRHALAADAHLLQEQKKKANKMDLLRKHELIGCIKKGSFTAKNYRKKLEKIVRRRHGRDS